MPEEKSYYSYEIPLDGKRTHIGGGWLPDFEDARNAVVEAGFVVDDVFDNP